MPSGTHTGWHWDRTNNRLNFYYRGTRAGHITGTALVGVAALEATTTFTAGTGWTDTTGNTVNTAGDLRVTAGNLRLGVVEPFTGGGATEPTSALVMKTGTAPAGAIATSCAIFSSTTVLRKIVAGGTVTNIEAA